MKVTKTVHTGGIDHHNKTAKVFVFESRKIMISELNSWLFDNIFRSEKQLKQLPPLDDWKRSQDDPNFWYINFPTDEWVVWFRLETVDFSK